MKREKVPERFFQLFVAALLCCLGCSSAPLTDRTPEEMAAEPMPPVTFMPGDEIEFKFYYSPELNDTVTVLPDGTISLQQVGLIVVAGKTPAEVREELINIYGNILKVPEVAVIPRKLYSQRFFIGGEVRNPGMYEIPGKVTLLEAIIQAGGFLLDTAELSSVIVIRQRNGKRYGCAVDLRDALEGKAGDSFFLQPHDIVWVPRTTIANVDVWVQQHIYKLIGNLGLIWLYDTRRDEHTAGIRPNF